MRISIKLWVFAFICNPNSRRGINGLKNALASAKDVNKLIHQRDRGVHYCCNKYIKLQQVNGIKISMNENGDPLKIAVVERLYGIFKAELLEP